MAMVRVRSRRTQPIEYEGQLSAVLTAMGVPPGDIQAGDHWQFIVRRTDVIAIRTPPEEIFP